MQLLFILLFLFLWNAALVSKKLMFCGMKMQMQHNSFKAAAEMINYATVSFSLTFIEDNEQSFLTFLHSHYALYFFGESLRKLVKCLKTEISILWRTAHHLTTCVLSFKQRSGVILEMTVSYQHSEF